MTEDDAREWLYEVYFDGWRISSETAARYDLTPILDDLDRVFAHLDAEGARIHDEDLAAAEVEQARADALPRRLWRVTYDPTSSDARWLITHRTPIECFNPSDGNLRRGGAVHGRIVERDQPVVGGLGCICIRWATIEATDEYADFWRTKPKTTIEEIVDA